MREHKVQIGLLLGVCLAAAQLCMAQNISAPSAGPSEGIKVHGSWTIVLRNSDGTVAATRKFENSLVAEGATFLTQILSRQKSVQYWQVRLINKDGGVCARGTTHQDCGILDTGLTPDTSSDFATLNVSAPTTGANAGKLVLTGSAPAAFDGQIKAVNTSVENGCPSGTCTPSWSVFTVAFPTPISVSAGQTMNVTVVISFS